MYWCLYRKVCRGFHGGLLEKARAAIQFTANYIYLFYYIMQHTVAVHVGTEAMMWLNRTLNMATDWSKVKATQARRETDKVHFTDKGTLYFGASMHFVELCSDRLSF